MDNNKMAIYMNLLTVPAIVEDSETKSKLIELINKELKKEE